MAELAVGGVCVATTYSPWLGIQLNVPPGFAGDLLSRPDAVQAAAQLGRLDFLTGVLASLAIFLTFSALAGFWLVRRAAISAAEKEIRQQLPELLPKFLTESCKNVLKAHPEIVIGALRTDPVLLKSVMDGLKDVADPATELGVVDDQSAASIAEQIGEGGKNGQAG